MNNKIIVIKPKTIDDVLVNPGIGFITFQCFNGDTNEGKRWTEGSPIEYQKFKGTIENVDYPQTSIAYFRLYWKYLEPQKGEICWDIIDKELKTAKERKQTLMLRIPPHGPFKDMEDVPGWYRKLVGDKTDWPVQKWLVNPEDPLYTEHYGGIIKELGKKYDGHPDLESIDASLIGAWGEGEGSELVSVNIINTLVDAYVDNFKKTPILMMIYNNGSSSYALSKADVGYRADCLGDLRGTGTQVVNNYQEHEVGDWCHMLDYYPREIILTGVRDAWIKAPVSFEVCWVVQHWLDMGWDIDYIIDQSLKWHISSFNTKSSPIPTVLKPKIERWLKKMGYRLALRRFTFPESINIGGRLEYTCWLENMGVAPCYKPFKFAFRLKNINNTKVFVTDAEIIKWLPGDSIHDGAFTIPIDLPQGTYEIQTGIIDENTLEPKVKFAMEGMQDDGWYTLGKVEIKAVEVETRERDILKDPKEV